MYVCPVLWSCPARAYTFDIFFSSTDQGVRQAASEGNFSRDLAGGMFVIIIVC